MINFKRWELIGIGLLLGLALNFPTIPTAKGRCPVEREKTKGQKITLEEVNKWKQEHLKSAQSVVDYNPAKKMKKNTSPDVCVPHLKLVKQPNPLKTIKPKPIKIKVGKSNWQIKLDREEKQRQRQRRIALQKAIQQKQIKVQPTYYQPPNWSVRIVGYSWEQCVPYARRQTGNSAIRGWAGAIQPNSWTPRVGAGALEYGHVSVVIGIYKDHILVREANWWSGRITERVVSKYQIRGYRI